MKIRRLDIMALVVPLRTTFRTASLARQTSENVVVRVELEDGTVGFGEGLPREYVTGETVESCFAFLSGLAGELGSWEVKGFGALVERLWDLGENSADGPPTFSARCALELALLEAGLKRFGGTFDALFDVLPDMKGLHCPREAVRYSVVASLDEPERAWRTALKYRLYRFRQVKVKLGEDAGSDGRSLETFRRWLGRSVEIRADANGSWSLEDAVERMGMLRRFGVVSVEQPLRREESARLRELREKTGMVVVLDESLVSLRDGMLAVDGGWGDVFNLRLSKCGGILACLRLAELARRAGLRCQLGCHPGETAILSAAGRHFATCVGPLSALEGSYDRHVLGANVIDGDITFGFGGKAGRLTGPGWGIRVDPKKLEALTSRHVVLEIS